jgi:hypothetical protein
LNQGYVKLWRKSLESPSFHNEKVWKFWSWCLMKASHKECKIMVGFQEIALEPGQFVFGRIKASEELRISQRSIRTCVVVLCKTGNMTIKTTNKFSIISIINWKVYQGTDDGIDHQTDKQTTNKRPTNDHKQEGTKNVKNKTLYGECVSLTSDEYKKLTDKHGHNLTDKAIELLNNYIQSSGKKYKSHYHTLLLWPMQRAQEGSDGTNRNIGRNERPWIRQQGQELSGEAQRAIDDVKRLERARAAKLAAPDNTGQDAE